ncbi:hypothetical protein ACIA58_06920 [Kribbella sp. NPDC051586]|uniref:hypothetical protein n=1 Tax=Kribbella sp. NPDC051586 TaxID=3364118 RepID=UPI003792BCFD
MNRRKFAAALAGAVALSGAVLAPSAHATGAGTQSATAACGQVVGSVTAAGAHTGATVMAGTPPTTGAPGSTAGVFKPGQVRLSTTFVSEPSTGGVDRSGYVVEGDSLYYRSYNFNEGGDAHVRIGGGWSSYTALEVAEYAEEPGTTSYYHRIAYGLRSDGTLLRWNLIGSGWRSAGSATGFASVKSMVLISKTRTYDTFLANTRGGALYTIRIPIASPMKPIVKQVRTSTWQGFETLIAGRCGKYGTLLIGIDKDARTANLYAVGHANGTATVINSLGKVANGTYADPVYFRWTVYAPGDQLNGD